MESEFRFQWGSQELEPKIGIPNQAVVVARCSAAVPPPPVVDGGEGASDDAGIVGRVYEGGRAKLVDGIATPCVAARVPPTLFVLPHMLPCLWEGEAAGSTMVVRTQGSGNKHKKHG
jgi:hypothetical protein